MNFSEKEVTANSTNFGLEYKECTPAFPLRLDGTVNNTVVGGLKKKIQQNKKVLGFFVKDPNAFLPRVSMSK